MNENVGEIILYTTEDGKSEISLKAIDDTVWLKQDDIAILFDTTKQNIGQHIKKIFEDGEQSEVSVVKKYFTTAADGKEYLTIHYNLDMILSIGYRVRSQRGVEFRKWANTILKEYLIKGFAMDDNRLKQSEKWDYFDEWLARIRDIRASEKRFYQKIQDLYATAVDYNKASPEAREFFKKVQAKMIWAVTGKTPAEILRDRSNAKALNMGLTSWKGSIVRKGDVIVSKNYLKEAEIEELNRIVTMYLDFAEDNAKRRKTITMTEWSNKLDSFLSFNDREVLTHGGSITSKQAKIIAETKFEEFDEKRKEQEALEADLEDIKILEDLEKKLLEKK